mmetsp:Transcript_57419/g.151131  ORF Transcript_57419/g.151131 Transcript_57419/m.151131 type:complete len:213 (+) Transcript_57419:1075-1713(+)
MIVTVTAFRLCSLLAALTFRSCQEVNTVFSKPFFSPSNHCSSMDLHAWCALAARLAAWSSSAPLSRSCSACVWAMSLLNSFCWLATFSSALRSAFSDRASAFQFLKLIVMAAFLSPSKERSSASLTACRERPFFLASEATLAQAWCEVFRMPLLLPISHLLRSMWTTLSASLLRRSWSLIFSPSAASNILCWSKSILLSCSLSFETSSCARA